MGGIKMKVDKYLETLGQSYQNEESIITEIINLQAIQNLPKGTEFFISDIHGEMAGFQHIVNTGAGIIPEKISEFFGETLTEKEQVALTKTIAYPKEALKKIKLKLNQDTYTTWCCQTISQITKLIGFCSNKYSRSKLRKRLPKKYLYLGEELIYSQQNISETPEYFMDIVKGIMDLEIGEDIIIEFSKTLKILVIDHLHIVGDIYDRGPNASGVLALLHQFPSVDFQWGNHDILWMGAFWGSQACLATLLRIATRYGYLYELEKDYGLNLRSLVQFADKNYSVNPIFCRNKNFSSLFSKVEQALLIIQLKLEGQIIQRHPEFEMDDRLFLNQVHSGSVLIDNKTIPLINECFQLVKKNSPYELTSEEKQVIADLTYSFRNSPVLKKEISLLTSKGSLYLNYNGNLLYHGCIPMKKNGEFQSFLTPENKGQKLFDFFENKIHQAYMERRKPQSTTLDFIWYCWCGKYSPLFGKDKMCTFESYFIAQSELKRESNNTYFLLREKESVCKKILKEFGLDPLSSSIINGHTPVKTKKGESPIKANARMFVIDGGLCEAYQKTTGIAGYTLLNNSYGFQLVTHLPFKNISTYLNQETKDIQLSKVVEQFLPRKKIEATTNGQLITQQILDLKKLLDYLTKKKMTG